MNAPSPLSSTTDICMELQYVQREQVEGKEDTTPPHSIHHHSPFFTRPLALPSTSNSLLHVTKSPAAATLHDLITHPTPHPISSYHHGSSSAAGTSVPNGFAPLTTTATTGGINASAAADQDKAEAYRECLRNHAVSLGGHILDGCCEFMPRSVEDTLRCAACGCHRSFHRKATNCGVPAPESASGLIGRHQNGGQVIMRRLPLPLPLPPPPAPSTAAAVAQGYYQQHLNARPSSEESRMNLGAGHGGSWGQQQVLRGAKKRRRSRTKFTVEQKERMLAFAERVGWRIHEQHELAVQQFCSEVSVSRQALKVWMHNNKSITKVGE